MDSAVTLKPKPNQIINLNLINDGMVLKFVELVTVSAVGNSLTPPINISSKSFQYWE